MFRTEEQKKKLCSGCPIARVANIMGDSNTMLIIRDLLGGPKRFGGLETSLSGVSSRTLTKKLVELVLNGIVKRKEFKEKPPRVLYSLTKKGLGLHGIAKAMMKYGEKYL